MVKRFATLGAALIALNMNATPQTVCSVDFEDGGVHVRLLPCISRVALLIGDEEVPRAADAPVDENTELRDHLKREIGSRAGVTFVPDLKSADIVLRVGVHTEVVTPHGTYRSNSWAAVLHVPTQDNRFQYFGGKCGGADPIESAEETLGKHIRALRQLRCKRPE